MRAMRSPKSIIADTTNGYQGGTWYDNPNYQANGNLLINDRTDPGIPNARVTVQKEPTEYMLLIDGYRNGKNPYHYAFYFRILGSASLRERGNWFCHNNGANVLSLDNHVERFPILYPLVDASYAPRWNAWKGD